MKKYIFPVMMLLTVVLVLFWSTGATASTSYTKPDAIVSQGTIEFKDVFFDSQDIYYLYYISK